MTSDPIATLARRVREVADREDHAERATLARLLADPGVALVIERLGIGDLTRAAADGRMAAGPLVRMLIAAADVAAQLRRLASSGR